MNMTELKDIFLKIIKPHIPYKNLDDVAIMKLKLDDTEIDSLMLMEIVMELEEHGFEVHQSFMFSLDPGVTFKDIFDLLIKNHS